MRPTYRFLTMTFLIASISYGQPKLSVDKSEVYFGSMYGGTKKKQVVELKNIGNDTLYILSVQPQCGCTTVKKPKSFLLPGQSDTLELEFNSRGYRGRVEKQVSINTNDPTARYKTIKIIINVIEVLQPVSGLSTIWVNNAIIGKTATQTIAFKNVSGVPVVIQGDSVSSPVISLKMDKKELQPQEILNVIMSIQPSRTGISIEHFYIKTDNKNQPLVDIQVNCVGIKEN